MRLFNKFAVFLVVMLVLAFLIGNRSFSLQKARPSARRTSRPFTARLVHTTHKNADDVRPITMMVEYARRADGSFARFLEATSPGEGRVDWLREIFDTARNVHVIVEPFTKSTITYRHTPERLIASTHALESENCTSQEENRASLQTDSKRDPHIVMHGFQVFHSKTSNSVDIGNDKTGDEVYEKWTAPSLRCYALKSIDRFPNGAITETEVTSLVEGEPPQGYFEIPEGYVERSPKVVDSMYAAMFKGHFLWGDSAAGVLERRYLKFNSESENK